MLEAAIEAGAEDVVSGEGGHEIYTATDRSREVAKALEAKFGEPRKAALVWKPKNTVAVDDEKGEQVLGLLETLNEHDDVQNVYANFEVSDARRRQDERLAQDRIEQRQAEQRRQRADGVGDAAIKLIGRAAEEVRADGHPGDVGEVPRASATARSTAP